MLLKRRVGPLKLDVMRKNRLGRCTFIVGALLFGVWLAQNWVGERTGFTTLLLYLPQHGWGLPPLLLLIWALRARKWRLALPNLAVLVFWAQFLLGVPIFGWSISSDGYSTQTRLMTYNIERGAGGIDALEAAIRAQKPDILCLQESQGTYRNQKFAPGARLAARFPGWSVAQSGDVMTVSRFPLESQRSFPLRGTRRILETTYVTSGGRLRVLNVHISTSVADQPAMPRSKMSRLIRVVREAKPGAQTRLEQIAPLRVAIENGSANGPLLVAGDFNSPPRGLFYRAISRGLSDAWQRGGLGTGHTFPAHFPLLPIDHVLSRGLFIEGAFVPAGVQPSDHRALVVDFR